MTSVTLAVYWQEAPEWIGLNAILPAMLQYMTIIFGSNIILNLSNLKKLYHCPSSK